MSIRVAAATVVLGAAALFATPAVQGQTSPTVPAKRPADPETPAPPTPARTPLSQEEALRRLEDARAALPEPTPAELKQRLQLRELEVKRLQEQIRQLNEEMTRLKIENEALRLALETIRSTPIRVAAVAPGEEADAAEPKPKEKEEEVFIDEPRWTVQYSLGLIDNGGGIRILKPTIAGVVSIRDIGNYDRNHVAIRGNFKNESLTPYRYTFEIRIGGRPTLANNPPKIIGSWRYQTPLLQPGEIHQFEVKVPVTHAASVTTYEIGNVVADNPNLPPVVPDKDEAANAAKPIARVGKAD